MPENDRFLTQIFQKYWPRDHRKNWFLIFGLVHFDVKLHEDSESDLIFSNLSCKRGQKRWFITSFHTFERIDIFPNLAPNLHFRSLLCEKCAKIRSDSESSCNFASTCTKPKSKKSVFSVIPGSVLLKNSS